MHAVGVELPAMCVTESLLIQNVDEHFLLKRRRLNTKQNAPHNDMSFSTQSQGQAGRGMLGERTAVPLVQADRQARIMAGKVQA